MCASVWVVEFQWLISRDDDSDSQGLKGYPVRIADLSKMHMRILTKVPFFLILLFITCYLVVYIVYYNYIMSSIFWHSLFAKLWRKPIRFKSSFQYPCASHRCDYLINKLSGQNSRYRCTGRGRIGIGTWGSEDSASIGVLCCYDIVTWAHSSA